MPVMFKTILICLTFQTFNYGRYIYIYIYTLKQNLLNRFDKTNLFNSKGGGKKEGSQNTNISMHPTQSKGVHVHFTLCTAEFTWEV